MTIEDGKIVCENCASKHFRIRAEHGAFITKYTVQCVDCDGIVDNLLVLEKN